MLFASLVPAISLADHSVQRDGASTTLLWSSLEARDGADKLSVVGTPSPDRAGRWSNPVHDRRCEGLPRSSGVRTRVRFSFRTHILGVVPASDVNWLADVRPKVSFPP